MRNRFLVPTTVAASLVAWAIVAACSAKTDGAAAACETLLTCCGTMTSAGGATVCLDAVTANDDATCAELFAGYTTGGECSGTTGSSTLGFSITSNGTGPGTSTDTSTNTVTVTGTSTNTVTSASTNTVTSTSTNTVTSTDTTTTTNTTNTSTTSTPADAGTPIVPAGAKPLVTGLFVSVVGLTTDDYLVYYDLKGGISASDVNGNITQIAAGPTTDGGAGPVVAGLGGQFVGVFTDYTTRTVDGTPEVLAGTLSIWSHALGHLQEVTTDSIGLLSVATDSSYLVYADGADTTGTKGNLGIVGPTGVGGRDFLKNVVIDTGSATCAPWAVIDGSYLVASSCALTDGGNDTPTVSTFEASNGFESPTVLATNAGPSSPYTSSQVNFATDAIGDDVLVVSGTPAALSTHPITNAGGVTLAMSFAAPTSGGVTGTEFFYLSQHATFAVFTQASAELGLATFATPQSVPVVTTLSANTVLGVQVISPDEKWDVDYSTALDETTGTPTALSLRNLSTGVATPLVTGALATTFGGTSGFTADSTYAIFSANLVASAGTSSSTGDLETAAVATGTISHLVTSTTVWNAAPLTGTKLIYNQNYAPNTAYNTPNGGASADIYVASAAVASEGKLLVLGADAGSTFYLTADKSHLFFNLQPRDVLGAEATSFPSDGLYSIAIP